VLGTVAAAAEQVAAVNHVVATLDRLAAVDPRFRLLAWGTLGLGRPLWEVGGRRVLMVRMLKALRRIYGV
jgi:hypothetical protein